ncbi:nucleotidyltransferase [Flammeovirga sp. MY04]|uniref:HI0074 family nucleotidyltransferase substrate-binding subunit n=1 Tax=Flammeovirga sp. MY04 TaxID=1191459 RepID=UPI00080635B4|nr:HI0074 family nucleotidyltransferase substrate-binding subunit [Flammeovirga sp. MY04]ANQ48439.1 nucleotidyltransferase [Flammeovirga sp. MY04]
MTNFKETRWKERYQDLSKSFQKLQEALKRDHDDEIIRAGIIQFFEMTFELSWKTLKDYLESEGLKSKTPKGTLKQAFHEILITDGYVWIDALNKRDLINQSFDERISKQLVLLISSEYYLMLEELISELSFLIKKQSDISY